jgi:flagellar export protein FliJ
MGSTLARVQKLYDRRKDLARLELVKAQRAHATEEEHIAEMVASVARAREGEPVDTNDLAERQLYALRMELGRRDRERRLAELARIVDITRDRATEAGREARRVERIIEIRAEQEAVVESGRQQRTLDEAGAIGWTRRNSS